MSIKQGKLNNRGNINSTQLGVIGFLCNKGSATVLEFSDTMKWTIRKMQMSLSHWTGHSVVKRPHHYLNIFHTICASDIHQLVQKNAITVFLLPLHTIIISYMFRPFLGHNQEHNRCTTFVYHHQAMQLVQISNIVACYIKHVQQKYLQDFGELKLPKVYSIFIHKITIVYSLFTQTTYNIIQTQWLCNHIIRMKKQKQIFESQNFTLYCNFIFTY